MIKKGNEIDNYMKKWRNLPMDFIDRIPPDVRAEMTVEVEKQAKLDLAETRVIAMAPIVRQKRSHEMENITRVIAVAVGALTFSLAPQLLASQAGRGPLVFSAGLLGGGYASYLLHDRASRVCTGIRNKQSYEQKRRDIQES
jgi:hypothetical protein